MKKLKIIILVVIGVILTVTLYFWTDKIFPQINNNNINTQANRTYPETENYPQYSLKNLMTDYQNETLKVGRYNTEGFVIDTFKCPPCPYMAVCMPCQPDALIVSEENKSPLDTKETIRIEAENLEQFVIGQKYKFSVSIEEDSLRISLLGYQTL